MLQLCQIVPYTAHLPSRTCRSWQELSGAQQRWSCGRLLLTPRISHPILAGLYRNSAALSTAGALVPYTTDLPSRTCRSQQELWQIVPYTAHLPFRTCRSWQELNSARHRWSCGKLSLTIQICHPGPVGPGRSSAALAL